MRFFSGWKGLLVGLFLLGALLFFGSVYILKPGEVGIIIEYTPQEIREKIGYLWDVFGYAPITVVQSIGGLPAAETMREMTFFPTLKYGFIERFLSQGGTPRIIKYEDALFSSPLGGIGWRPPWPLATMSKLRLDKPHDYEIAFPLFIIDENWVDVLYLRGNFTITDINTWVKEMYSSRQTQLKELDYTTPQGRMAYFNLLRGKERFQAILTDMLIPYIERTIVTLETEIIAEELAQRLGVSKKWVLENSGQILRDYPQEVEEARKKARSYIEGIRKEKPQEMVKGFLEALPEYSKKVGISFYPEVSLNFVKEPLAKWRR